jgi:hypothetical protein
MPNMQSPAQFALWSLGVFVFATIAGLGWHFADVLWRAL